MDKNYLVIEIYAVLKHYSTSPNETVRKIQTRIPVVMVGGTRNQKLTANEEFLDAMYDEGWELVSHSKFEGKQGHEEITLIFKKR